MKKLFTTFIFALLIFGAVAQSQISELQKGLIFRWEGSEWNPYRDVVSGALGTGTATYNVLGRDGSGRRWLENINTSYSSLADDARYDFGTSNFTLIASFTPANITDNGKYLISKEAGGIGYGIYQEDNDVWIRFDDNTTDVSAIIGTDVLVAGTKITCEVVFNRAGNAVLYLNGSTSSSGTVVISTASLTLDNTGAFVVGNIEAHNQGFTGQIHFVRAFNFALTDDIVYYSKPENPIKATHIGSGATKNVLDLNAEGLAQSTSGYWYDKTNSLTATNSGTTLVIPPASNLKGTAFNGTTSKVVFSGLDGITGDMTISFNYFPLISSGYQDLFATVGGFRILQYNYYLNICRDGLTMATTTGFLNPNINYSIVITSTSTGYTSAYSNGVLVSNSFSAGTPVSVTTHQIGCYETTNLTLGRISNVNRWSRILSQDEITLVNDTGF